MGVGCHRLLWNVGLTHVNGGNPWNQPLEEQLLLVRAVPAPGGRWPGALALPASWVLADLAPYLRSSSCCSVALRKPLSEPHLYNISHILPTLLNW